MDARGGKILEFLKENSHLDLEVPDIAFNVKKSEKTVETALKKLQQQGLVTARQNEFGRVYWYALPSAPTNSTAEADEAARPPATVTAAAEDEDGVDLFSLPKAEPSPAPAKGKRTVKKQPAPAKSAMAAVTVNKPEPTQVVEPPVAPTPPEPVVDTASGDFEIDMSTPQPAEALPAEVPDGSLTKELQKTGGSLPVFAAVALIGVVGLIALVRSGGAAKKIEAMGKTIPKDVVATADFKPVQEQAAKIGELEAKITALAVKVDSLSAVLAKVNEPKEAPKPVRRPVRRRR